MTRTKEVPFNPAKYLLDSDGQKIDLLVHTSVLPKPSDFKPDDMAVRRGRFQIPGQFTPPSDYGEWGFGKVITVAEGPTPEWIKYVLNLPPHNQEGTDWNGIINTVATLNSVLDRLNFSDGTSQATVPQLQFVDLALGQTGIAGWPLSAEITPALGRHLDEEVNNGNFPQIQTEVNRSMFFAYSTMIRLGTESYQHFRLERENSLELHVDRPTSASLHTSNAFGDGAFYLMPHNVIVPQQQLSLFAGLARLGGLASQKIGF